MAAEVEKAYPDAEMNLVEASGGLFEVTVDGDLVFSKKDLGRQADEVEVLRLMRDHLGH